jgi:hypothetical protein
MFDNKRLIFTVDTIATLANGQLQRSRLSHKNAAEACTIAYPTCLKGHPGDESCRLAPNLHAILGSFGGGGGDQGT